MKKVITLLLIIFNISVVCGVSPCDSVKLLFASNKATYDSTLYNNEASMKKFIESIFVAANSGNLDHIVVYGYASPEGPFSNNDKLSSKRCEAIADYISRHAGIPLDNIQTFHGGIAWEGLRDLVVENPRTPSRDAVLRILDEYIPEACCDREISDKCIKRLIAIDNGHSYDWMLEHLFPQLRYSLAVYAYNLSDSPIVNPIEKPGNLELEPRLISDLDFKLIPPSSIEQIKFTYEPLYRLAIKTNLLYYAALLPNLELEWLVNDNWSVSLDANMAWWGKYSNNTSYRLLIISPEVRRWIRPRAPWHGFYVGAFAGGGLYDFQNGGDGYHGEGAMGGLSVGYTWPIGKRLILEAEIGAGYLYTRYKQYRPYEGHHLYEFTKEVNYFGPLKAKFSIGWRFFDSNKPKKFKVVQ